MDHQHLVDAAERLSSSLSPGDLDETLRRITAAAIEVIPDVSYCSITIRHADGRLETVAPTHGLLREVDAAQYSLQEGPCYETAVETVHVTAPDLATDARFPRYAKVALDSGIRAQAGVRLFENRRSHGALNLYSTDVGSFSDLGALGVLFAHQSATAIAYAQEVEDLREAVRTRKLIGQAIGIVMERYQLSDQRAFAFLARLSQDRNVKLRVVADELVGAAEQKSNGPRD